MTDRNYPKCLYGANGETRIVNSRFEHDQLGEGWFESPWEAKGLSEPEDAPTHAVSTVESAPVAEQVAQQQSEPAQPEAPKPMNAAQKKKAEAEARKKAAEEEAARKAEEAAAAAAAQQ
jgi:hypothetical protein